MFKTRILTDDDFPMLMKWWAFFRFPIPNKEYLPEEGRGGIMIEKDGVPICAGYIFFTNSKFVWLEYIVSNPEYKDKDRKEVIVRLINSVCEISRGKGFKIVFTSVSNQNLINRLLEAGFVTGSENSKEMVKLL